MYKTIKNKITALLEAEKTWISQILFGDFSDDEIEEEIEKMKNWEIFDISDENRVILEHAIFLFLKEVVFIRIVN